MSYATPVQTAPAVKTRIDELFGAVAPRIAYLRDRWQDEREHEDFTEYVDAIVVAVKTADPEVDVVRVTKRPFAAVLAVPGSPAGATYSIKATGNSVGWSRVS